MLSQCPTVSLPPLPALLFSPFSPPSLPSPSLHPPLPLLSPPPSPPPHPIPLLPTLPSLLLSTPLPSSLNPPLLKHLPQEEKESHNIMLHFSLSWSNGPPHHRLISELDTALDLQKLRDGVWLCCIGVDVCSAKSVCFFLPCLSLATHKYTQPIFPEHHHHHHHHPPCLQSHLPSLHPLS